MTETTEVRKKRLCDVCGVLDDHPRHVLSVGPDFVGAVPSDDFIDSLPDGTPARAVAELMDPTTVVRHMDCCAANGCDVCPSVLAAAGGAHLKGDELVTALTSGDVDNLSTTTASEA